MSEKAEHATESGEQNASAAPVPRWRSNRVVAGSPRTRMLAVASCLLATLVGTLLAVASLPSTRTEVVLVSLYLSPPDELAAGVDAPHPPRSDRLFGLSAVNVSAEEVSAEEASAATSAKQTLAITQASSTESEKKPEPQDSNSSSAEAISADQAPENESDSAGDAAAKSKTALASDSDEPITDWRQALLDQDGSEQVVLHVSAMAKVEHDQVYFIGADHHQSHQHIALSTVLSTLKSCPADRKLLILEVHWPSLADSKEDHGRTQQLNLAITRQLESTDQENLHVLLSASGEGFARGLTGQPQSLLAYFLSESLVSGNADADHNGRITLAEIVRWAGPRIESVSQSRGTPQRIVLLPEDSDFVFAQNAETLAVPQREYPDWLAAAWQRAAFTRNTNVPWLPNVSRRWALRLSWIESRWRRGESEVMLQQELSAAEAESFAAINAALIARSHQRADSIRLAGDGIHPQTTATKRTRSANELLQQHAEIIRTQAPDGRPALIAKAVADYMSAFKPDGSPAALVTLLQTLDRSSHIDRDLLLLLDQVRASCKMKRDFPVTDAIENLVASGAGDHQQLGTLLKLYRIQDLLGSDASATAILRPLSQRASERMIDAQQLVWNPGMVSHAEIQRALEIAINTATSALVAEQSLSLALRRLRNLGDTITNDIQLGVHWEHDREYIELQRRSSAVVAAIDHLGSAVRESNRVKPSDLAKVRQASELLERHWRRMIRARVARYEMSPTLSVATVSTSLSARDRSALLNRPADVFSLSTAKTSKATIPAAAQQTDGPAETAASTASPLMCLSTLTSQLDQITQDTPGRYNRWLENFVGRARAVKAIPSYGHIAERKSIGGEFTIPVAAHGDLHQLTWDHPSDTIELHYKIDLPNAKDVAFEFLPPAESSLRIEPMEGTLSADQELSIQFRLTKTDSLVSAKQLRGAWLRLHCDGRSQLVPISMNPLPAQPGIDIVFDSSALANGRDVTLERWPDRKPQPLHWQIVSHDPKIKSVLATLESENGNRLTSAPIPLTTGTLADLRFLPAAPSPAGTSGGSASALADNLTLTITNPATAEALGRWRIATQLRDPRRAMHPGWAEFSMAPSGENRLQVEVHRSTEHHPDFRPTIRLNLDPVRINPLIDFGASRLQAELAPQGTPTILFAENLRFIESADAIVAIPLAINGDDGYCDLECRFPRRSGLVQMQWSATPRLDIIAPKAAAPGNEMLATVKARNLPASESLEVTILDDSGDPHHVLWRKVLPAARRPESTFISGGKDATLQIVASHHDWQITVPTDIGTGFHRLNVATTGVIGTRKVIAEHRFVVDNEVPDDIRTRAEVSSTESTVFVTMRPSPSGVAAVIVEPISVNKESKVKPMPAVSLAKDGARWSLAWPRGLELPERLKLTITSGAGKEIEATSELQIQRIRPIGKIAGRVLEGSIPQPRLTVTLSKAGVPINRMKTGDDGRYEFAAPPGKYLLTVSKPSTQRKASTDVSIQQKKTTKVDLRLLRSL